MKKYNVTLTFPLWLTLEVEAENKEEAEIKAVDEAYITGYCGNGGTDKLVGVTEGSIEVADECLQSIPPLVEEVRK